MQVEAIEKKPVKDVFGVDDPTFAKATVKIFARTADTPKPTKGFKFVIDTLRRLMVWSASASLPEGFFDAKMKRNLMIFGPTGCGKTELMKNFCGLTGRSLFRFQCSEDTEEAKLFGTWKLCKPIAQEELPEEASLIEKGMNGIARAIEKLAIAMKRATGVGPEMTYIYGPVLRWYTTPNAVLLLDEVDQLLPTVNMSLNGIYDGDEELVVPETGERLKRAPGTLVVATANTNGRGSAGGNGGSAALYKGAKRQNIATLDRFFVINMTYLTEAEEKDLLKQQIRIPEKAAEAMAKLAAQIRSQFIGLNEDAGANGAPLEFTITTRNLLNWGMSFQLLAVTGVDNQTAFEEALRMTLLDFGTESERKAVLDTWATIVGDAS